MDSISVQCRLMPDIEQTGNEYLPGLYYNILVSACNEKGVVIPCTVKFRATATLNDPVHKVNGTDWTAPVKSSMLGSVLWSINALTDTLPPPIEVQVDAGGTTQTVTVQPAVNLLGMLQKLSIKTTDDWCGFLSKGHSATNLMRFAASALSASVTAVYEALINSPSEADLTSLMKEGYDQQSGIFSLGETANTGAANVVSSTITADKANDIFASLMKAVGNDSGHYGEAGAAMKYFIKDASQLFQLMKLLLEQSGRELRDVFDWIGLDMPWQAIGESQQLLTSVIKTLIKDINASKASVGTDWASAINSFKALYGLNSSQLGAQMNELLPLAQGLQKTWSSHSPDFAHKINIDHRQFELGWLAWRFTHSMPNGGGPQDLIRDILKTLDFKRFSKALNEFSAALARLGPMEELQTNVKQVQSFFSKVLKGDTDEITQLLSGGPGLEALQAAPGLLYKLIDKVDAGGETLSELAFACIDLIDAFLTTSVEIPFLKALSPWLHADAPPEADNAVCFLDLMVLGIVTPGVVLYKSATGRTPYTEDELKSILGDTWSLASIPVRSFAGQVLDTLQYQAQPETQQTQQGEGTATNRSTEETNDNRGANKTRETDSTGSTDKKQETVQADDAGGNPPKLMMPSLNLPDPPPHFKEICDGSSLFLGILTSVGDGIADIINLLYDAEEIAVSVADSGNNLESKAASKLDFIEVGKDFLVLLIDTLNLACSTLSNVIQTVELYVLKEEKEWKEVDVGGPKKLIAFNPVFPTWIDLTKSGFFLISDWAFLIVDFILELNEDEQLGAGAADFEISGAAYTEADAQATTVIEAAEDIYAIANGVSGFIVNRATLANTLLYNDIINSNVKPMAESVLKLMEAGTKGDGPEASSQADKIGAALSPWHDWNITKLVCDQVSGGSRELSALKKPIGLIPEYGAELAFAWDLGCILVADATNAFSVGISIYQFNETYHPVDQQGQK
ncbi:MAG: hypothetical protein HEP71_03340 [Roseivirga sp.]|nr:hypothetical protein [Roseivirga sp.]